MLISVARSILFLFAFVASSAMAADALFRSSFESSICSTSQGEYEPNDFFAEADDVLLDPVTRSAIVCGVLSPAGADNDFFYISISSTSTAIIETIKADGIPCDPSSPMSLTLFDPSLSLIATDTGGGVGGCASLDGETTSSLQNLTPGNYYIKVSASFNAPAYALSIMLQ